MTDFTITSEDISELRRSIKAWRWTGDSKDKEILKTYAKDREDLGRFLDIIEDGNLEKAEAFAERLDTVVRDQIPTLLYYKLIQDARGVRQALRGINKREVTWCVTLVSGVSIDERVPLKALVTKYGEDIEKIRRVR